MLNINSNNYPELTPEYTCMLDFGTAYDKKIDIMEYDDLSKFYTKVSVTDSNNILKEFVKDTLLGKNGSTQQLIVGYFYVKFMQNPDMKELLKSTDGYKIIYNKPGSTSFGSPKNNIGIILMGLRKIFISHPEDITEFENKFNEKASIKEDNKLCKISNKTDIKWHKPKGIYNLGNTCFMNAALQALYNLDEFRDKLIKIDKKYLELDDKTDSMLSFLKYYFINYSKLKISKVDGKDACKNSENIKENVKKKLESIGLGGWVQHDSAELMGYVLADQFYNMSSKMRNGIYDLYNIYVTNVYYWILFKKNDNSPRIFKLKEITFEKGVIDHVTRMDAPLNGKDIQKIVDNYIKEIKEDDTYDFSDIKDRNDEYSLKQSQINQLNFLLTSNDIDSEEYYVKKGKRGKPLDIKNIKKNDKLWLGTKFKIHESKSLPKYLIIALKRFKVVDEISEKIHDSVDINLYLIVNNINYRVKSIVIHSGGSSGGHYYAYVRRKDNKWYNVNDYSVSDISEENVLKNSKTEGYIIIYERL
jgi:uncharacterized UBP type Zn finger protein